MPILTRTKPQPQAKMRRRDRVKQATADFFGAFALGISTFSDALSCKSLTDDVNDHAQSLVVTSACTSTVPSSLKTCVLEPRNRTMSAMSTLSIECDEDDMNVAAVSTDGDVESEVAQGVSSQNVIEVAEKAVESSAVTALSPGSMQELPFVPVTYFSSSSSPTTPFSFCMPPPTLCQVSWPSSPSSLSPPSSPVMATKTPAPTPSSPYSLDDTVRMREHAYTQHKPEEYALSDDQSSSSNGESESESDGSGSRNDEDVEEREALEKEESEDAVEVGGGDEDEEEEDALASGSACIVLHGDGEGEKNEEVGAEVIGREEADEEENDGADTADNEDRDAEGEDVSLASSVGACGDEEEERDSESGSGDGHARVGVVESVAGQHVSPTAVDMSSAVVSVAPRASSVREAVASASVSAEPAQMQSHDTLTRSDLVCVLQPMWTAIQQRDNELDEMKKKLTELEEEMKLRDLADDSRDAVMESMRLVLERVLTQSGVETENASVREQLVDMVRRQTAMDGRVREVADRLTQSEVQTQAMARALNSVRATAEESTDTITGEETQEEVGVDDEVPEPESERQPVEESVETDPLSEDTTPRRDVVTQEHDDPADTNEPAVELVEMDSSTEEAPQDERTADDPLVLDSGFEMRLVAMVAAVVRSELAPLTSMATEMVETKLSETFKSLTTQLDTLQSSMVVMGTSMKDLLERESAPESLRGDEEDRDVHASSAEASLSGTSSSHGVDGNAIKREEDVDDGDCAGDDHGNEDQRKQELEHNDGNSDTTEDSYPDSDDATSEDLHSAEQERPRDQELRRGDPAEIISNAGRLADRPLFYMTVPAMSLPPAKVRRDKYAHVPSSVDSNNHRDHAVPSDDCREEAMRSLQRKNRAGKRRLSAVKSTYGMVCGDNVAPFERLEVAAQRKAAVAARRLEDKRLGRDTPHVQDAKIKAANATRKMALAHVKAKIVTHRPKQTHPSPVDAIVNRKMPPTPRVDDPRIASENTKRLKVLADAKAKVTTRRVEGDAVVDGEAAVERGVKARMKRRMLPTPRVDDPEISAANEIYQARMEATQAKTQSRRS